MTAFCSAGTSGTSGARQPFAVQDASNDVGGDAFDGAMGLYKADNPFVDSDGMGELHGDQLSVGPEPLGRLKVRQTHRALPTAQTLRALVKLKNPTDRELTPRVTFSHQYGSDSSTAVRATSTGNLRFDRHDRWAVTSDDADSTELGDPVVTTVNYGKGKDVERTKLQLGPASTDTAEDNDAADCAVMLFELRLPAESSRYLLFSQARRDQRGGDCRRRQVRPAKAHRRSQGGPEPEDPRQGAQLRPRRRATGN